MPVGHSPPSENTRLKAKQSSGALQPSVNQRERNNDSFSLPAPSTTTDLSWSQQCSTPTTNITQFEIPTSLAISTVTLKTSALLNQYA